MTLGPDFMFCADELIFGGTVGVGSRYHVLRSRTRFRRCRVSRVPFSCFAHPDSFSAVPRVSGPVIMFFAPEYLFGGAEGVGSRFHFLRSRTRFLLYRVRRVPFSYFVLPDSFSTVPRPSDPVFMFSSHGHHFGGAEGFWSHFHVLCSQTRFRRYRRRRVQFSFFARRDSFSAEPRVSAPVFMFFRSRTHFRQYLGHHVLFSCFAIPGTFSAERRRPVSISCFALPESFSAVPRASVPVFMFCAPRLIFGGTEGVGSRFHIVRARTHFQRYRGCLVPFSCFTLLDSFSAMPSASGAVLMFCAPGLIFWGTEGVRSHFHVFRSRTCFRQCGERRVPFSCIVIPNPFSAVPRASGPVFMFCTPRLVFDDTEGDGFRCLIFHSRTHFRRYGGCRVPFSCFACSDLFSVVSRALGPVFTCFAITSTFSAVRRASDLDFMFCAPGLIFNGTEVVVSLFHVLRAQIHFRRYRGRWVLF
jgi:hypothetical protein